MKPGQLLLFGCRYVGSQLWFEAAWMVWALMVRPSWTAASTMLFRLVSGKIVSVIREGLRRSVPPRRSSSMTRARACRALLPCFGCISQKDSSSSWEGRESHGYQPRNVLMAKDVVKEPFCVINCDDFCNRDCFYGYVRKQVPPPGLPEGTFEPLCHGRFRAGSYLERERYRSSRHLL